MDLREYLFRKRITATEFAKQINYSPHYLYAIIGGSVKPGRKFKEIVKQATNGEVIFEEETEKLDKN